MVDLAPIIFGIVGYKMLVATALILNLVFN